MDRLSRYATQEVGIGQEHKVPLLKRLDDERNHLLKRIEEIDRARVILTKYPEIEELINLL